MGRGTWIKCYISPLSFEPEKALPEEFSSHPPECQLNRHPSGELSGQQYSSGHSYLVPVLTTMTPGILNWVSEFDAQVCSVILLFGRERRYPQTKRIHFCRESELYFLYGWQGEGTIHPSVLHFSLSQLCNYFFCPSWIACWTLKL